MDTVNVVVRYLKTDHSEEAEEVVCSREDVEVSMDEWQ